MNTIIKFFIFAFLSFLISSCSSKLGKTIGLSTSGPDEYSVTRNRPLEIPPHFQLNEIENEKKGILNSNAESSLTAAEKALLEASRTK